MSQVLTEIICKLVDKAGLSYSNARSLHKFIKEIPAHVEWESHRLSFRDTPEEDYILHYRSPLEVIKALLGDPALAEHIVYKPKRIFTNASKEKWVYNEMWTGMWWEEMQVSMELVFMMPSN